VGGYSSFPVLKYAQHKHIPTFIHESNSFAGKSNIWLGKSAARRWPRLLLDLQSPPHVASRLSAAGVSDLFVAQMIDHSSPGILQRYAKAIDEYRRDAVRKLEEMRAEHAPIAARSPYIQ